MEPIANTTDQKFLEAILSEQRKTNGLLGELLCLMRKDKGEKPKVVMQKAEKKKVTKPKTEKSKRGNENVSKSHSTSSRCINDVKFGGDSPKRGGKRQTVHDK